MRLYRSKFEEVVQLLDPNTHTLLDVGCRDGRLKKNLPSTIEYSGIDLFPGPYVSKVCNIEQGIPYPDNAFDAVVALDILEHTDNIWFSFSELARITRHQLMVVLPNSYHWKERLRFLRGKEGGKHIMSPEPIQDRHRWLPSYTTSYAFARHMADKYSLSLPTVSMMVDDRHNILRELAAKLFPPNLMSVNVMFLFEKPSTARVTSA
ncbi:MAG: class I SAM-dependent methyltransferase [Sulfuricaulis sp.]|nr:class I SAM-dependent methyltransferase [Sulfuricaulis sp.]